MIFSKLSLSVIGLHGASAATLRGDSQRDLQVLYYPRYTGDYATGWCTSNNKFALGSPGYSTELACCNAVFGSQTTGKCLSMLPSPPTVSPTGADGPDAWYSNQAEWSVGKCINTAPVPNGRTVYETELECCKAVYVTQESGYCLTQLPNPPTVSPTATGGPDAWYSNNAEWSVGKCINTAPVPSGRIVYDTELECCKGAYGSQESGYCLTQLPSPPTVSPTATGGPDAWYANFELDWADGVCINTAPVPSGRIVYDTELECCKGAYGSQESGACLASLPSPPTVSPTATGGPDAWYSNNAEWSVGKCINTAPVPSGRTAYESMLECCKGAYATQESGYCLTQLPSPPTVSPTATGGPDAWYSNNADWSVGKCINTAPVPSGRTVYDSMLECCKGAYASQESGYCLTQLPAPPTVSPTATGGPDAWYSNNEEWSVGKCINTAPVPSGRLSYDTQLECCKGAYATQESGACLASLPSPPTSSPIGADAEFFPIWSGWNNGHCDNEPTKRTSGNTYSYATQRECCDAWFGNQQSGACMNFVPTYGSKSPTQAPIQ